jgi:electron transfer flavoprotein beta subunit
MKAKKKPFRQLTLDDLGVAADSLQAKTAQTGLFLPPARKAGQILQGDLTEQVSKLAELLHTQTKTI